ncbi:unnamed protein product [Adineta ricciae]|uniref:Uncharacterized protein n=1 Tax=Adineta ricciae TaxID=249248 RepID=A0A815RD76_ADIRI|nr:unnamed protein product [Adineta ricciae]
MLEQISTRSRRNSTVSTLCDQTQSQQAQTAVFPDTISSTVSYNLFTTMDIQRSFSFPTIDQHQYSNVDDEQNQFISEENEGDITTVLTCARI